MSSGGPQMSDVRARTRDEIVDQWLPVLVDDALATREIATGVAQAGLDPVVLRQQVLDAREEVLAPADTQLDRAVDAMTSRPSGAVKVSRFSVLLQLVGVLLVAGPVLALVLLWTSLAWWVIVLGAVGAVVLTACGALVITYARLTSVPPYTNLDIWKAACRDEGVLPYVRRVINEHLGPLSRLLLGVTADDAPGLRGTSESSFMVRTSSVKAFQAAVARLPTGAVGIAGPRGVGKTSLIDHFAGQGETLKVTVSAPVQYEPRDFVLHLFASVCRAVLRQGWVTGVLMRAITAVAFPSTRFGLLFEVLREPRHSGKGITSLAREHLENIHYLRTHTSGWSGKVTLPLRSAAGWSRQTQRERRPQTYPELVNALREFLAVFTQSTNGSPAMIIAIDELDKIGSPDRAQQFLNEIKGIFGAPGTQFLVAVSEDALAAFERRGLPVRDAFDSAFHEIIRVDYLTLEDTAELLSSRVLGMPEPFTWLVHCMSGGLPRDVVRTARAMVSLPRPAEAWPGLDDVCGALVADDLTRKSHAFQLACRHIGDSPDVTEFIRSLRRLPGDAAELLSLVPELRQDGELATLSREAAAYVYYSATLLEVFTRDRVDSGDGGTFDLLARAKQSLAVHPRLAWLQVDEFHEAWGLPTVPVD